MRSLLKKTLEATWCLGVFNIGSVHKWSRHQLISGGSGSSGFRVISWVPLNESIDRNRDFKSVWLKDGDRHILANDWWRGELPAVVGEGLPDFKSKLDRIDLLCSGVCCWLDIRLMLNSGVIRLTSLFRKLIECRIIGVPMISCGKFKSSSQHFRRVHALCSRWKQSIKVSKKPQCFKKGEKKYRFWVVSYDQRGVGRYHENSILIVLPLLQVAFIRLLRYSPGKIIKRVMQC